MRQSLLEMLEMLIPFNQASFYVAKEDKTGVMTDPVGIGISDKDLQDYIDCYKDKDYTRLFYMCGNSIIYRETDLIPDKLRETKEYFREIYVPSGIYYSLQMSIGYGGRFLGVLSLYRRKRDDDFSDEDIFILELIKNHLENRLWNEVRLKESSKTNGNNRICFDSNRFIKEFGLTMRELEVLEQMFFGLTNEAICDKLSISNNTLKKHGMNIYKKLGIKNRWELINFI